MVNNRNSRCWESGMKIEFLEFKNCLQTEEFLNLVNVAEAATVKWPFTSKVILDPIVDWNKPPIFNEELFIAK